MLRDILNNSFLHRGIFLMFGFITLCSGALSSSIDGIPEEEIIESSKRLVFYRNGYEYAVVERSLPIIMPGERPTAEEVLRKARTIIDLILAGPSKAEKSAGIFSAFPEGTKLNRLEWDGEGNLTFYFKFPAELFRSPVEVYFESELMHQQLIKSFICLANVRGYFIMAYDEKGDKYRPLSEYCLPEELQQERTMVKAEPAAVAQPAVYNVSKRQGALSGKTVYLWPGHGYTISIYGGWGTQRPNCYNLCEDYIDIETMAQYLARYCYNAGAYVVMNRERDFNPNMVIVDNEVTTSSAGMFVNYGFYLTSRGPWPISDEYSYSYSPSVSYPLIGNDRPFVGLDHASVASADATTSVTWIANIPADGYYSVYISYGHERYPYENVPAYSYVTDAHYIVKHAGGTTEFRVNQQRHQCTWVFLGEFYFYQGINPDKGAVMLDNQSNASVGLMVSADAVRFGGGMGNVARFEGISGFCRWEEATKYYAQFAGPPKKIFHPNDGSSEYSNDNTAAWIWPICHHQDGENAAWLRFHTNAGGGSPGTETYIYPPVLDSADLRDCVHDEIINDIRKGYYSTWIDRGKMNYSSGYNDELAYVTVELAFHDREYPDNTFLKDPKFRQLCSRAMFQGLVKYFANKDASPVRLLPEPPRSFMVRNTLAGIQLRWDPPETDALGLVGDVATSYVVYLSFDGKAWDNGRETVQTEYTFPGLTPDDVYYFRVTAINEGGESFPTKTLSARVAPTGEANILIVDGYDRLDRYCLIRRDGMPSLGTIYSMELSKMNMFDNIIRHARAMENYGAYFDSADKMAIMNGLVDIGEYTIVDWLMGKQGERVTDDNTVDFTFNDILRNDVKDFLLQRKSLFVSGTDIGYDLDSDTNQTDAESIFFNEFLKADYVSDDLNDYWIKGAPGSFFKDIPTFRLDDANYGLYDADSPDVLSTIGDSEVAMTDASGSNIVGVQYFNSLFQIIYFSFPFETIVDEDIRNEVMRCVLDALMVPPAIAESYWQLYQ